jgi:SAM-dependent methyltransferase
MSSASARAHEGLPFANPLAEADVDAAVAALQVPGDRARVLETGCGSGELLRRVLDRLGPGARGVGVDPDAEAIALARARLGDRAELVAARADEAALEPGVDVVVNVAASHAHGGWPAAVAVLAGLARPGGWLLLGEGFWAREPSFAFLEALGGATPDELGDHDALLASVRDAGLEVVLERVARAEDWARYEETLAANAERAGDPESAAYARRIRSRRALPGGTTTLGFSLLVARRQPASAAA